MSLLGIDVGTSGCKVIAFREDGRELARAYRDYDVQRPRPGWSELDALDIWNRVRDAIREVAVETRADSIQALAVSSLGESMVPVGADRKVLGPSILMEDTRGADYLPDLARLLDAERLYGINGNTLGNQYGVTKLMWIRDQQPGLFEETHKFLLWSGFVSHMLGAAAAVDYSLANRTLLFDIHACDWSDELVALSGLDQEKLPRPVPSGQAIGTVSAAVAKDLGLPSGATIVAGAHDQCANALGCGTTTEGQAMLGMGTYLCMVPTFHAPPPAAAMMAHGLNTEHHAVPGLFVSFIYNQGGSLLKWFRNTFAQAEHAQAQASGRDVYAELLGEMPEAPGGLMVLPHFAATGPPDFITDSRGVIAGLRLDTSRGEIAKAILEGAVFYLRDCVEELPATGIRIDAFRAVGGGTKSDAWVQISADIMGRPFVRPEQTEAGALGAAILAGAGAGVYQSPYEGAERVVRMERTFEPDPARQAAYCERFEVYRSMGPSMRDFLRTLSKQDPTGR